MTVEFRKQFPRDTFPQVPQLCKQEKRFSLGQIMSHNRVDLKTGRGNELAQFTIEKQAMSNRKQKNILNKTTGTQCFLTLKTFNWETETELYNLQELDSAISNKDFRSCFFSQSLQPVSLQKTPLSLKVSRCCF